MPEWNEKLRTPDMDQLQVKELIKEMSECLESIRVKIETYKDQLLLNKKCSFEPAHIEPIVLGQVVITDLKPTTTSKPEGSNPSETELPVQVASTSGQVEDGKMSNYKNRPMALFQR
jgi:hypothetical protein